MKATKDRDASFGFKPVAPEAKQGLVNEVFARVAPPLRPDERSDVRRPAPAVEGRCDRLACPAQSAPVPSPFSTSQAAPAISPQRFLQASGSGAQGGDLRYQRRDAGGRPRAGGRGGAARLRAGKRRGFALSGQELRRLYHRLRHAQSDPYRCRARRGLIAC